MDMCRGRIYWADDGEDGGKAEGWCDRREWRGSGEKEADDPSIVYKTVKALRKSEEISALQFKNQSRKRQEVMR